MNLRPVGTRDRNECADSISSAEAAKNVLQLIPGMSKYADQMGEGASAISAKLQGSQVLKALGKGSVGGCFSDHATKASCDASAGCAWCTSAAVPPACNTLADARKLPPSVFKCDKLAARAN